MSKILRAAKRVFAGACATVFLLTSIPGDVYAVENDIPIETIASEEISQERGADLSEEGLFEAVMDAEGQPDSEAAEAEAAEAEVEAEATEAESQSEVEETASSDIDEDACELEEDEVIETIEGAEALDVLVTRIPKAELKFSVPDADEIVEEPWQVSDYQNVTLAPSSNKISGVLYKDQQGEYSLFLNYSVLKCENAFSLCYRVGNGEIVRIPLEGGGGMLKISIPMDENRNTSRLKIYVEEDYGDFQPVSVDYNFYLDLCGYSEESLNFRVEPLAADEVLPDCESDVYGEGAKASRIQRDVSFEDGKVTAKLFSVEYEGKLRYYLAGKLSSDLDDVTYVVNENKNLNHINNPDLDGAGNDTFLIECNPEGNEGLDISVLCKGVNVADYHYDIRYNEDVIFCPDTTVQIKLPVDKYEEQSDVRLGTDDLLYGELSYNNGYRLRIDIKSNSDYTVRLNDEEITKSEDDGEYERYLFEVSSPKDVITVCAQSDKTYGVEERKILLSKLKFEQPHEAVWLEAENVNPHDTYPAIVAFYDSIEFVIDGTVIKRDDDIEDYICKYDAQVGDKYQIHANAKPGTKIVSYRIDMVNDTDSSDVKPGKEVTVKNNKLDISGTVQKGYRAHVKVKVEDGLDVKVYDVEGKECLKNKDTYIIDKSYKTGPNTSSPNMFSLEQYSNLKGALIPISNVIIMDGKNEITKDGNYEYDVEDERITCLRFTGECFEQNKVYQVILQRSDEKTGELYDSQSFKIKFAPEPTSIVVKKGGKAVSTITMTAGSSVEYDYSVTPSTATGVGLVMTAVYEDGSSIPSNEAVITGEFENGKCYIETNIKHFRYYCAVHGVDSVTYLVKPAFHGEPLAKGKAFKVKVVAPKQIEDPVIVSQGMVYDKAEGKYVGYKASVKLPKSVNEETIPCEYRIWYDYFNGEHTGGSVNVKPDEDTGKFDTEVNIDRVFKLPDNYDGTQAPMFTVILKKYKEGTEDLSDRLLSESSATIEFNEYWATSAKDMTVKQVAKTVYTGQTNVVIANVKYADKVICKGVPDVYMTLFGKEINLTEEGFVDYNPISGDVAIKDIPEVGEYTPAMIKSMLGKQKITIKAAAPVNAGSEVSKTITVDFVKGIDSLDTIANGYRATELTDLSHSRYKLYKPAGKALSIKFTTDYNFESGIAPKTKKVTYKVTDYEGKPIKGVTVKNGKITIDKSYNVKDPKYGDMIEVKAYAEDYKGNRVESKPFWISVFAQKPQYDELLLVEYHNGVYNRINSTELFADEIVNNTCFYIAVRTSDVPVKDKYKQGELILAVKEGYTNFSVKASNKKVIANTKCQGAFEPIMSTVKGVVFTATATDGSKVSVKSGKYDIIAREERVDFGFAYGASRTFEGASNTVVLSGESSENIDFELYGINAKGNICEGYPLDLSVSVKNGYVKDNEFAKYSIVPNSCTKPVIVTVTDNASKPKKKKVITFKPRDDVKMTVKPTGSINSEAHNDRIRVDVTLSEGFEPKVYDGNNADKASIVKFTYMGKDNENYDNLLDVIGDNEANLELSEVHGTVAFLRHDEDGYYAIIDVAPKNLPIKKGKYNMACYLVDRDGVGKNLSTGAVPVTFEVKPKPIGFNPSAKGTEFTMTFDGKIKWTETSASLSSVTFGGCSNCVIDGRSTSFKEIYKTEEDGSVIMNQDWLRDRALRCNTYEEFVELFKEINENSVGYVSYTASAYDNRVIKTGKMLVKIKVQVPSEEEYLEITKW